MTETVLFIGGPEHGKMVCVPRNYQAWEVVDPLPRLEVTPKVQDGFFTACGPVATTTVYRRTKLCTPDKRKYEFFIPRDWLGHPNEQSYIMDGLMQIARSKTK